MTRGHARKNRNRRAQERTGAPYTSVAAGTLHDHDHTGDGMRAFSTPTATKTATGRRDADLVAGLYDAALDSCSTCRIPLLERIAASADATTRLVTWVCLAASETFGGLPEDLTDNPWLAAPWRELATAWEASYNPDTILGLCTAMTAGLRREAACAATDVLVALTHHGSDVQAPGDIRYCPVCCGGDGHPDEVYLATGPGVWDLVTVTDPVLAAASRIYQRAADDTALDRGVDLYKALRSVVVATLPEGEADYAAYPIHLEDFAIRDREQLHRLFTRYSPRGRAGTPGRIQLLDHLMSIPLCERLESARSALERVWHRTLPPLEDFAAAWASARR
ncbi:hypothetical protein ACGF0D_43755 [Kitasatospora sp. NPDC048298]|uniref:hypothetical protein n=1 Tax=Kitasatospora sp. NPDC048298 TaxID=3364049 RepID=UPI003717D823